MGGSVITILPLYFGSASSAQVFRLVRGRDFVRPQIDRHHVEPLRDSTGRSGPSRVRDLVEVLRLERHEHALARERGGGRRIGRGQHVRQRRPASFSCWKRRRIAEPPERNISTLMPWAFSNRRHDLLALFDRRGGVPGYLARPSPSPRRPHHLSGCGPGEGQSTLGERRAERSALEHIPLRRFFLCPAYAVLQSMIRACRCGKSAQASVKNACRCASAIM